MRTTRRCQRLGFATLLFGLATFAAASTSWAQGEQATDKETPSQTSAEQGELERLHFAAVRERYASAQWTRGPLRAGLANRPELPGWSPEAMQSDRGLLTRSYRRASAKSPSFVLETYVAETVEASHDTLVTWLAGLQSLQTMPAARDLGIDVGDVGFVGRSGAGPRAIAWIAFVRGNIAVRISAFDARREPKLDLAGLVRRLDAEILKQKPLAEGAALLRPSIAQLIAERSSAIAGEALQLDFDLADPDEAQAHLEWVVGGPGQGYVERGADGIWRLHTTGPGAIHLTLQATNSLGGYAERSLDLTVADD